VRYSNHRLVRVLGAEARYWRHYGYHWYGRSWSGFSLNGDVRQVEKQLPSTEPGNDPRNEVGDFGAAIEQMIHTCDRQVAELKDMPLDAVARIVDPTPNQGEASASIHERLETLSRALDAMAASLATLRPTFDKLQIRCAPNIALCPKCPHSGRKVSALSSVANGMDRPRSRPRWL
jgi:hypothetical protein